LRFELEQEGISFKGQALEKTVIGGKCLNDKMIIRSVKVNRRRKTVQRVKIERAL
jgi:hypothetical protein